MFPLCSFLSLHTLGEVVMLVSIETYDHEAPSGKTEASLLRKQSRAWKSLILVTLLSFQTNPGTTSHWAFYEVK